VGDSKALWNIRLQPVSVGEDGSEIIVPVFDNVKGKKPIGGLVVTAAMMAFGGPLAAGIGAKLGTALSVTSALGQAALGGAALGAGTTALMGGKGKDILKGAVLGGVGAGVSHGVANANLVSRGLDPKLMTPSPTAAKHAGLLGSVAGGATTDLLQGQNPVNRYKDPMNLGKVAYALI